MGGQPFVGHQLFFDLGSLCIPPSGTTPSVSSRTLEGLGSAVHTATGDAEGLCLVLNRVNWNYERGVAVQQIPQQESQQPEMTTSMSPMLVVQVRLRRIGIDTGFCGVLERGERWGG